MSIEIRRPNDNEMESVYMMGFDVWADGTSREDYLCGCRESPKYKQGTWYVLVIENSLVSSLITYPLSDGVIGIGSIATDTSLRKHGYAAKLVTNVIQSLERKGTEHFMLYTEVGTVYYEKLGFLKLEDQYQKSKSGIAMLRGEVRSFLKKFNFEIPKYF